MKKERSRDKERTIKTKRIKERENKIKGKTV